MAKKQKKKVEENPYKFRIQRLCTARPKPRDFYGFFTNEQWRNLKTCDDDGVELDFLYCERKFTEEEFFKEYPEFCPAENTEIKVKTLKKDDKSKAITLKKSDAELFNTALVNPKPVDAIATKEIETDDIEAGTLHEVLSKDADDVINELKGW